MDSDSQEEGCRWKENEMFYTGLAVGLFIGFFIDFVTAALMVMVKKKS